MERGVSQMVEAQDHKEDEGGCRSRRIVLQSWQRESCEYSELLDFDSLPQFM